MVHMAIIDEATGDMAVVSLACPGKKFPSVGAQHAPAIRLERAIHSLYGYEPTGAPDTRPWLDLGFWDVQPSARRRASRRRQPARLMPSCPWKAKRCTRSRSARCMPASSSPDISASPPAARPWCGSKQRLGYVHKGIESLMTGATLAQAARLAGADLRRQTVAYGIAFAHAVEAALDIEAPPRARYLRALMAELERLANHLGDIGAICNDASFSLMHAHCGILRERVLRAADACFGHRLMMDRVVPGGVAVDLAPGGADLVASACGDIRGKFPRLVELYDNTASLQDRTVGDRHRARELARQFGAAGYVGRASGRDFDARKTPGYAPYDELEFRRAGADRGRRQRARLDPHPRGRAEPGADRANSRRGCRTGRSRSRPPARDGEGLGLVGEFPRRRFRLGAARGGRRVARCHLRDPSWFQWPLLEAAIEGNIVADFPLCNKSFNCSYSGHDL